MVKEIARFCAQVGIPSLEELLKKDNHTEKEFLAQLESGNPQNTMRLPTKEQIIEVYKKLF